MVTIDPNNVTEDNRTHVLREISSEGEDGTD
jgi:hypothetical protein